MMKISIIVPVYNTERYLNRCIESIINQTFRNIELILINDGSTDKSGEICDEYLKKDKRISVIHKKNGGVSSARNLGINKAHGDYVTFIDSDDFIDSDFIENAVKSIEDMKVPVLVTAFVFYKDNKILNIFKGKKKEILNHDEAIKEFFLQDKFSWAVCDKFYDRNIIKHYKFNKNFKIGEDMLFFWQILNSVEKIGYIPLYKYYYDISASNTMKSVFSLKWFHGLKVKRKIYNQVKNISKELETLSKIVYIVEMVILSKKAITSDIYNTERLVKLLQYYIRKNIYILFFYPRSNIMTFYQKMGMIYFLFPYKFCKLVSKYIYLH